MKSYVALFYLMLAFALIGAPFGMGRMMDAGNHATQAMDHSQMGHAHHGDVPAHEPSTLHFVMCAACFAAPVVAAQPLERIALDETVETLPVTILHGKALLPDLPPPRA